MLIKQLAQYGGCTSSSAPAFFSLDSQFAEDKLCHDFISGGLETCLARKELEIARREQKSKDVTNSG
jgi:hypothetical protein